MNRIAIAFNGPPPEQRRDRFAVGEGWSHALAGWLDAGKAAGYPIKLLCAQAIVRAAFAAPATGLRAGFGKSG